MNALSIIRNQYGVNVEVNSDKMFYLQHSTNQFSSEFNRFDVIVRYLAIENYYNKNDFGMELYLKMQNMRKLTNKYIPNDHIFTTDNFVKLIRNFEVNGFEKDYPVLINRYFELVDGSHRFSLSLYHNIPVIPVQMSDNLFDCRFYYGMDWFIENNFSETEISLIKEKYDELNLKFKKQYIGIIWPAAYNFSQEIISYFDNVIETKDIEFPSLEVFKGFLFDIYSFDIIADEKIECKFEYMKEYPLKIKIFYFSSDKNDSIKRITMDKVVSVSQSISKVKEHIRENFSRKIEKYFYDIVLHLNDNEKDYSKICEVINTKYKSFIKSEA